MKANLDKFHLLLTNTDCYGMEVCSEKIESSFCEKLLGIKLDTKLKFSLKSKSMLINALPRISSYMRFQHGRLILNSFLISHFSYCSIVWVFHGRRLNNRVNSIHERTLRII